MSVYIKGFPLPNNCGACPLRLAWCRERIYMVTRPERCPLVPVPPHGRLIDADELRWCYDNSGVADDVISKENYDQLKVAVAVVRQTIDDAPTIIEAEEGE